MCQGARYPTCVPITPTQVAARIVEIIEQRHELSQVDAVVIIESEFGPEFIRDTTSGGSSIDRRVLRAMKALSDENEWIENGKLWRIKD